MKRIIHDAVIMTIGMAAFSVAFIILSLIIHGKVNW